MSRVASRGNLWECFSFLVGQDFLLTVKSQGRVEHTEKKVCWCIRAVGREGWNWDGGKKKEASSCIKALGRR